MIDQGDELLEHILASPDDTAARLVYADWLLDRGEPRGELIRLQCEAAEGPLDDRKAKRLRGLLRSCSKTWLGPIATVTDVRTRVWDRGFLAAARVEAGHFREMRSAIGHPEWRTVRFLDAGCHQMALDLVSHAAMRSLRTVTRLLGSHFHALAESSTPHDIEELDLLEWRTGGDCALTSLGSCPALPRLRALVIGERAPDQIPWLFDSPLCERLEVFGMHYNVTAISAWQDALDGAPSFPLSRIGFGSFELPGEARIGLSLMLMRTEDAGWSRIVLRRSPTHAPNERLLNALASIRVTELVLVDFDQAQASEIANLVPGRPRITTATRSIASSDRAP